MPANRPLFNADLILEYDFPKTFADIIAMEHGKGPMSKEVEISMHESVAILAKLIVDETPVNFGHLSGAISQSGEVWYGQKTLTWYGQVTDGGIKYAEPVEYGIKPFFPPKGPSRDMVDNTTLWVVRKQLQWYRTLKSGKSKALTPEQMAWALSWHIAKHGTEGAHMFEKGIKQGKPHVDKVWSDLLDRIEKIWGKGA